MQTQQEDAAQSRNVPTLNDDDLLSAHDTARRCGGVSRMTLYRWQRDPKIAFPRPVSINNRNYWQWGHVRAWKQRQAQQHAA